MHIHHDIPGVLSRINDVFSKRDINISGQYLRADGEVGYVVTDVIGEIEVGMGIRKDLQDIEGSIEVSEDQGIADENSNYINDENNI